MKKKSKFKGLILAVGIGLLLIGNPISVQANGTSDENKINDSTKTSDSSLDETKAAKEEQSEEGTLDENSHSTVKSVRQPYAGATATPLTSFPSVSFDYTTPLDSKYSFFPRMNNKSKVLYEATKKEIPLTKGSLPHSEGLNVVKIDTVASPGKIRVTNIGMYQGEELDLLINLTYLNKVDYKPWLGTKVYSNIELGLEKKNFLDIYMSGDKGTELNLTLTTVVSGTNIQVPTSGIISFEGVSKFKKLLIQKSQVKRIYTPGNSEILYGDIGDTLDGGNSAYFFMSNLTEYLGTVKMVQQYENLSTRAIGVAMLDLNNSVKQGLSSPAALSVQPDGPVISGKATVVEPTKSSNYTVMQNIPAQPKEKFKSLKLDIKLEPVFYDINTDDIYIEDQNGQAIGESNLKKEIKVDENGRQILTLTATNEYLNSNLSDGSGLYSNTLEIKIPVKLDYKKDYSHYLNAQGEISVEASAKLMTSNVSEGVPASFSTPIKFSNKAFTTLNFVNKENKQFFDKTVEHTIGSDYDLTSELEEVKSLGTSLISVEDSIKGTQTPEDISVKVVLEDKRFTGDIEIYKDNVLVEDSSFLRNNDDITVVFHATYNGTSEKAQIKKGYVSAGFKRENFKHDPTNIQVVDKEGKSVGKGSYNPIYPTFGIEAKLNAGVPISTDIYLKYDATVLKKDSSKTTLDLNSFLNIDDNLFATGFYKSYFKKVELKEDTTELTVNFVDEKDNPIHEPYVDETLIGSSVDLRKNVEVTDILTKLKAENYDLTKKPENEVLLISDDEKSNVVTYKFTGILKILSAPDLFDFEVKKATINAVKFTDPKIIGQPLVVSDTRADKVTWNLKAKVEEPLTSLSDEQAKMPDSIKYKYQDDELTLTDQNVVIFSHLNTVSGSYDVTKERWSKGEGFMLDLEPGSIKALGKYHAQITITLENAK